MLSNEDAIKTPSVGAAQLRSFAFRLFLSAERDEQQLQSASASASASSSCASLETSSIVVKRTMERYGAAARLLQVYRGIFLETGSLFYGEIIPSPNPDDQDSATATATTMSIESELSQVDEKSKYAKWRVVELRRMLESLGTKSCSGSTLASLNTKTTPENATVDAVKANTTFTFINANANANSNVKANANLNDNSNAKAKADSNDNVKANDTFHMSPMPTTPPAYNLPLQQPIHSPSPTSSSHNQQQQQQQPQVIHSPTLMYDPKVLSEAEKQARFAISALHFDDISTAIQNLQRAIAILQALQDGASSAERK